jgi:hypothetical protein
MKWLTGQQDVKQKTNITVGPVYFFLPSNKYDLKHLSSAQPNKKNQNHKLMCTAIYSLKLFDLPLDAQRRNDVITYNERMKKSE